LYADFSVLHSTSGTENHKSNDRNSTGESIFSSITVPGITRQPKFRGARRRVTKERKEERKRQHLPRMKKSFSEIWLEDVLPKWGENIIVPIEALCFAGIPKEIRGRAWSAMLGNKLQINEQLFDICKSRAKAVILEMTMKRDIEQKKKKVTVNVVQEPSTVEPVPVNPAPLASPVRTPKHQNLTIDTNVSNTPRAKKSGSVFSNVFGLADQLIAEGERNIRLVKLDMPRTFGNHPLFQDGAIGTQKTYEVLEAYTCYRPDLGYVQGMIALQLTI